MEERDEKSYRLVLHLASAWQNEEPKNPALCNPILTKNYLVGTDGSLLIYVDNDIIDSSEQYHSKNSEIIKKAEEICEEIRKNYSYPYILLLEDMKETLQKRDNMFRELYSDEYETVNCPECKGGGRVFWRYRDFSKLEDCPYCDGTGVKESTVDIEEDVASKVTKPYIRIGDTFHISSVKLRKLIVICEHLNVDSIRFNIQKYTKMYLNFDDVCKGILTNTLISDFDSYVSLPFKRYNL